MTAPKKQLAKNGKEFKTVDIPLTATPKNKQRLDEAKLKTGLSVAAFITLAYVNFLNRLEKGEDISSLLINRN